MKMNNKNNNIFHTGFYNEFIWNMRKKIEEIENPDYTTELNDLECPYEDAYIFYMVYVTFLPFVCMINMDMKYVN